MTPIKTLSGQFALHNRLFNNVLEDIEDPKGAVQMNDEVNHLQWIAGHLTNARYGVGFVIGLNIPFPYVDLYRDPTKPPPSNRTIDKSLNYPSLTEIKKYWNDFSSISIFCRPV